MIIAIDIGGTNTRIALIGDDRKIVQKISFPTKSDIEEEAATIAQRLAKIPHKEVTRAVAGVPGVVSEEGVVISSPNLVTWEQYNIKHILSEKLDLEVLIVNDAELAAIGEAAYGAGKDYHVVAFLTISTGIGGARIVGKSFDTGLSVFEPGRQIIDIKKQLSLQDIASGAAVRRETGKAPREVTNKLFWKRKAEALAVGVWNSIVHWSPQIIVFGGPMILRKPGIDIDEVEEILREISNDTLPLPTLALSALGDDAALYGALAYDELLLSHDDSLV